MELIFARHDPKEMRKTFLSELLKTDDDVFVDTIHLPTYLRIQGVERKKSKTENFILCFAVLNTEPGRE